MRAPGGKVHVECALRYYWIVQSPVRGLVRKRNFKLQKNATLGSKSQPRVSWFYSPLFLSSDRTLQRYIFFPVSWNHMFLRLFSSSRPLTFGVWNHSVSFLEPTWQRCWKAELTVRQKKWEDSCRCEFTQGPCGEKTRFSIGVLLAPKTELFEGRHPVLLVSVFLMLSTP